MVVTLRSFDGFPDARVALLPLDGIEPDPERLHPRERSLFEALDATDARRREWFAGRIAARAALTELGYPDVATSRRDNGAPHLEGEGAQALHVAITHGKRLAAAVAAHASGRWPHVGIDVVDAEDLDRVLHVAKRVLTDDERARAAADPMHARLAWGAREAIAKATNTGMFVFALSRVWTLAVDAETRTIAVNLEGIQVVYAPLDDGGVLVLAGASKGAYAAAQAAART